MTQYVASILTDRSVDPFTPKLKKYILPTLQREVYEWGGENW